MKIKDDGKLLNYCCQDQSDNQTGVYMNYNNLLNPQGLIRMFGIDTDVLEYLILMINYCS